uniref:Uncharacterized protein n=1 Tax=Geospiza parvula TaxID=87175 RepID=A0A8U8BM44_GEOPR
MRRVGQLEARVVGREWLCAMECNAVVQEGLRHSNARFTASMKYSHPFKDDILVSTDTLTCDTPDRPKSSQPSGSSPRMQASYWFRGWGAHG